jgi:hypothetical protein
MVSKAHRGVSGTLPQDGRHLRYRRRCVADAAPQFKVQIGIFRSRHLRTHDERVGDEFAFQHLDEPFHEVRFREPRIRPLRIASVPQNSHIAVPPWIGGGHNVARTPQFEPECHGLGTGVTPLDCDVGQAIPIA